MCLLLESSNLLTINLDQVIIAFFIATAITFSSIIFGYLTDSLPDSVLSDVDHYVIARLQTTFVVKRLFPWIGKLWLGLKSLFYRSIGKNPPSPRDSIPREQRIAALIRLLLGFSDQQLITGLAIFIAALANRCRLVAYELEILHSLAWFSATTHIATLTVLQEFFYANPVIRNWRVIGMSTFAGLLIFFEVITGLTESDIDKVDPATPIQCVIDGRIRPENLNAGNFLLNVYYLFMFFLPMYIINVIDLFIDPRFTGGPFAYLYLSLNLRRRKVKGEDRRRSLINSSIQKDTILSRDVFSGPSFLVASLSRYATSFLSFFTVIPFFLVYNFINTTMVTWFWGIKTTDKIREMGFGQVVALALLAIPILTATEIYNGEPQDEKWQFPFLAKLC